MPIFDFTAFNHKKQSKTSYKPKSDFTIVERNVIAVAIITPDANYLAVNLNTGEAFNITSKSYKLKTNICYSQQLVDNKRIKAIKIDDICSWDNPHLYLPFAPGVGLYGNIIKSNLNNSLWFDLKKSVSLPKENELSKKAFLFYREHYEEIYVKLKEKYGES